MVGTIVYAESTAYLELFGPRPFMYIEGGFVRWVGISDSRKITASVINLKKESPSLR